MRHLDFVLLCLVLYFMSFMSESSSVEGVLDWTTGHLILLGLHDGHPKCLHVRRGPVNVRLLICVGQTYVCWLDSSCNPNSTHWGWRFNDIHSGWAVCCNVQWMGGVLTWNICAVHMILTVHRTVVSQLLSTRFFCCVSLSHCLSLFNSTLMNSVWQNQEKSLGMTDVIASDLTVWWNRRFNISPIQADVTGIDC